MTKFHPERDCDFFIEQLVDYYHDPKPNVLRRNQLKNRVRWFRDPTVHDINRSVIPSWGYGCSYKDNTGLKCEPFIKTRIRRKCALPVAGRRGMWQITRTGTAGMCNLMLDEWNLEEWLKKSSFRKKTVEENSEK